MRDAIQASNPDVDLVASIVLETKSYNVKALLLFGSLLVFVVVVGIANSSVGASLLGGLFFGALCLLAVWSGRRNSPTRLVPLLRADPTCVRAVRRYTTSDSRGIFRTTWLAVVLTAPHRPVTLKVGTDETAVIVAQALRRLSPDAKIDLS